MHRREFIAKFTAGIFGITFLTGCGKSIDTLPISSPLKKSFPGSLRFGLLTDSHYADRNTKGSRYYRHSLKKMENCISLFNVQQLDFIIETGDFKEQSEPADETSTISYLQVIEKVFQQFDGPAYHALGNHDMDSISKPQFLANIENTGIDSDRSYYSFDVKGVHCIVLDANFKSDGSDYDRGNFKWEDVNIPEVELDWLENDLAAANGPAIVFLHQCLDGKGRAYVNNAADVRKILEDSGKVAAVFQGHRHSGDHNLINGIHYYTLKAMCQGPFPQNNAYAVVELSPNRIFINGYASVEDLELS